MRSRRQDPRPILIFCPNQHVGDYLGYWLQHRYFDDKVYLPYAMRPEREVFKFKKCLMVLDQVGGQSLLTGSRKARDQKARLDLFLEFRGKYFTTVDFDGGRSFCKKITGRFNFVAVRYGDPLGLILSRIVRNASAEACSIPYDSFLWADCSVAKYMNFVMNLPENQQLPLEYDEAHSVITLDPDAIPFVAGRGRQESVMSYRRVDPLSRVENRDEVLAWYENSVSRMFERGSSAARKISLETSNAVAIL